MQNLSEEGITVYEDINDTHMRHEIKSLCWNTDIMLKTTINQLRLEEPSSGCAYGPMISLSKFFGTQVQKCGTTPGKVSLRLGC